MPLSDPQSMIIFPHQINVPVEDGVGLFISVQLQSDGTADPDLMDTYLQSMIDHLQLWEHRREDSNVTGSQYDVQMYVVTPTDGVPPPPPPEDPSA